MAFLTQNEDLDTQEQPFLARVFSIYDVEWESYEERGPIVKYTSRQKFCDDQEEIDLFDDGGNHHLREVDSDGELLSSQLFIDLPF
jgi:hypothetical protein